MTRRLLNFLTALSLLLCVAVVALCVRSYFRSDWLCYTRVKDQPAISRADDLELLSGRGNAWVALTRQVVGREIIGGRTLGTPGWTFEAEEPENAAERSGHRTWGFGYEVL